MIKIPQSIGILLEKFAFREKPNVHGINAWITSGPDNPVRGINHLTTWQEHYPRIVADGGACIYLHVPNNSLNDSERGTALEIIFPASGPYMNDLFDQIGFGVSGFGELAKGGDYVRRGINREEIVLERRGEALTIFKEMQTEAPVVLTQLGETKAVIKMPGIHDREFLEKWGTQVWEFYKTFYQTNMDIHPVHSFTKNECLRLARKFGCFFLGGYG